MNKERLRDNLLRAIGEKTYREIGEGTDINPVLVGLWARGERFPGLESLVKISRFTGVSMDTLTEGILDE